MSLHCILFLHCLGSLAGIISLKKEFLQELWGGALWTWTHRPLPGGGGVHNFGFGSNELLGVLLCRSGCNSKTGSHGWAASKHGYICGHFLPICWPILCWARQIWWHSFVFAWQSWMGSHHGMLGFGESHGSGQPNGGLQHHPGVHARRLVRPCGGPLGRVCFRGRISALLSRGKACGRSRASDLWEKWQTF